eukprot:COSAG04_NODE_276_length_18405_cov_14.052278_2_plen_123_part_00
MALWSTPFLPNLMNSTVFLVETAQIIAVLFVNYKGRPWMNGLLVRLNPIRWTSPKSPLTFGCAGEPPAVPFDLRLHWGRGVPFVRGAQLCPCCLAHCKTMINMIHDGLLTPDLNDLTYHSDT